MTHVTCRLTAKNRDQLRNHTLGNRVWATFSFYTLPTHFSIANTQQFATITPAQIISARVLYHLEQPYTCILHFLSIHALYMVFEIRQIIKYSFNYRQILHTATFNSLLFPDFPGNFLLRY